MLISPPPPDPRRAARFESAPSITARTSSIHCSSVGSSDEDTGSESPVPRWSKQIRRENEANLRRNTSNRGSIHCASIECQNSAQ
jgi:hypothetical protein